MDPEEMLSTRKTYELVGLERIQQWMQNLLRRPLALAIIGAPSSRNGFSGETFFLEDQTEVNNRPRYILRQEALGPEVVFPPGGDFLLEAQVQQALSALGSVPVPPIIGIEGDSALIGRRFYVMSVVQGDVPCDNPGYHRAGTVAELAPDDRHALAINGIESLAALARVDPKALNIPNLWRGESGQSEIAWDLDYYRNYWLWAKEDLTYRYIDVALAWADRHAPHGEPTVVSWGDARYGNVIFDNTRTAALIDWEMVTIGSPEKDLCYWTLMDEVNATMIASAPLEGWPSTEEFLDVYERALGRCVDFELISFYRVFAAIRLTIIYGRFVNIMRRRGKFPKDMIIDPAIAPVVRILERELRRVGA